MEVVRITLDLSPEMALEGYRQGIFPMGHPNRPEITWHRPAARGILPLQGFHLSRSLARTLKKGEFEVTFNRAFLQVLEGCASRESTWITQPVRETYAELHRRGYAHSVEVWVGGQLAGGLYGVHLGGAFFAESKFHRQTNMSKVALFSLVQRLRFRGFSLLDVQYWTPHLSQFGVIEIPDSRYRELLRQALRSLCSFP